MSDVNSLISKRFQSKSSKKMDSFSQKRNSGQLSSFAGVFTIGELEESEKLALGSLLANYAKGESILNTDIEVLTSITAEIKAIRSQAALLHGERIEKAHELFKKYNDGAFSAWLIAVYGNRQTPYNFLQYYQLYKALPKKLHTQAESMPRQAIYTLASRKGSFEKKQKIIEQYNGETKIELLRTIRKAFPLPEEDQRAPRSMKKVMHTLAQLKNEFNEQSEKWTDAEKSTVHTALDDLKKALF